MNKYIAYDIYEKKRLIHRCYERISEQMLLIEKYKKDIKKIEKRE